MLSGCTHPPRLALTTPGLEIMPLGATFHGKPFTGSTFELSATGDTLASTSYQAGKLHGWARSWYALRRPREARRYVDGREEGLAEGWFSNGRRQFQRTFRAGVYHGTVTEWYSNGQLYHVGNYAAGQEQGRQLYYQPEGSIRANYDARNGRQYGLIGSKHCATPR